MEIARQELAQSVKIIIDKEKNSVEQLSAFKSILQENDGKLPVFIHLNNNGSRGKLFSLEQYRVSLTEKFIQDVKKLFGNDAIKLNSK